MVRSRWAVFCLELAYFHGNFVRLQSSRLSFFIPVFWSGFWLFWLQQNGKDGAFSTHFCLATCAFSLFCPLSVLFAKCWWLRSKNASILLFAINTYPSFKCEGNKCNKPLIPNIFIWCHVLSKFRLILTASSNTA